MLIGLLNPRLLPHSTPWLSPSCTLIESNYLGNGIHSFVVGVERLLFKSLFESLYPKFQKQSIYNDFTWSIFLGLMMMFKLRNMTNLFKYYKLLIYVKLQPLHLQVILKFFRLWCRIILQWRIVKSSNNTFLTLQADTTKNVFVKLCVRLLNVLQTH